MKTYSGKRKRLYAYTAEVFSRVQTPEAAEPGPCWVWEFGRNAPGYGIGPVQPWTPSRIVSRQVWALLHGPIASNMCVCHRCDTPACFRPSHLFLGSRADNSADMTSKGRARSQHGEASGRAKLTDAQVDMIRRRRAAGERCDIIAADFSVHPAHISRVTRGLRRPAEHPAEAMARGWSLSRVGGAA